MNRGAAEWWAARAVLALLACACTTTRAVQLPLTAGDIQSLNTELAGREVTILSVPMLRTVAPAQGVAAQPPTIYSYTVPAGAEFDARQLVFAGAKAEWSDAATGEKKTLPADALQSVKRLSDGQPHAVGFFQGAGLGLLCGAGIGAMIGVAGSGGSGQFFGPGASAAIGAVLFALPGTVVGAIAGAIVGHHDQVEFVSAR